MNNSKHLINVIKPDKGLLRKKFKEIRKKKYDYLELYPEEKLKCQKQLRSNLFEIINKHSKDLNTINMSCYTPIKDEIDCLSIIPELKIFYQNQGKTLTISIPKTNDEERALTFYEYKEEFLVNGKFKIKEPDTTKCKEILPYFILTPLLSFDSFKHRLGYGKGNFDNTFLKLKNLNWEFISIGIAYDELYYDSELPVDKYDQHLNYVVTPSKIF